MREKKASRKKSRATDSALHIHIFSHTHWDFEWYEVQEGYKLQLVRLMDHLLKLLEKEPTYKFHFDGQVMPICDYLEVLEERDNLDQKNRLRKAESDIRKFVQQGQLVIGPCWSTPETSIISTESLIRNINRGIRFSKKLGVAGTIFYNADAFQYHSQVPQIIEQTGLTAAFTWRSFKEGKPLKDLTLWEGADKTAVVKYHPPRTYAQVWQLPEEPEKALNLIVSEAEKLAPFAVTRHVLITQGNDQFEAQSDLMETLEKAKKINKTDCRIDQVSLEDFFRIVGKSKLSVIQGELTGNKWACTMSGQLSARMYLKQINKIAETAIEKWAEPFASFASLLGDEYPAGLMERAWEYLMKQHFHHCNACAIDEVHREGEVRYNSAIELAKDITDESLRNITLEINSSNLIHKWERSLVVFNPTNVDRSEVIRVEIVTDPVKGDADWQTAETLVASKPRAITDLVLWDEEGEKIPYQVLSSISGLHEIAFFAENIPPFGYKTFGYNFTGESVIPDSGDLANEKEKVLENDLIRVSIRDNGTFSLFDKRNNVLYKNLNVIEDTADHGDSYNYDPLKKDKPVTTYRAKGKTVLKENGPFLATCEVKSELVLPESLSEDRKERSRKQVKLPIVFQITVMKDSPLVHIAAHIDNRVKDHRMRALFPGIKHDTVYVQTQSDIVRRKIKKQRSYPHSSKRDIVHQTSIGELPKEIGPSPTQFQRDFVGFNNGEKGLIVFNKGLPEYEAKANGTIALTLLRAVGWLSQDDLASRVRLAGPKLAVPDAQCFRKHTFEYAVLPQSGPWDAKLVYQQQQLYSLPVKHRHIQWQKGQLPTRLGFVRISPDQLMIKTVKKAYSDSNIILRVFNPTDATTKGQVEIISGIKKAWIANMNEEKKHDIPLKKDGPVEIEIGPKKIMTISILPGEKRP